MLLDSDENKYRRLLFEYNLILRERSTERFCRILRQVRRLPRSMRQAGESGKSMMFRMGRVRR